MKTEDGKRMTEGGRSMAGRWILCLLMLLMALLFTAKARGGVVQRDALPKRGGELKGPIKSIKQPGEEASFLRMFSFSPEVHPDEAMTNETLRVLRIWNDRGTPRIDLRRQGDSALTVRISSGAVEMPVLVMQPQATPPTPVVGGLYVSTSGAIYICASLATGWEML